jgi:hypothetical protein
MIDLDAVWTEEDELYCRLALPLLLGYLDYAAWKALAEWMGVFEYIFPDRRDLADETVAAVMVANKSNLLRGVTFCKDLEAHYTEQQQIRIVALLEEPSDSRMEKPPQIRAIITEQEL